MARAESQGLQIALIVFVALTIVLGVVAFFYVRSYQEETAKFANLKQASEENKRLATNTQDEINKIKVMLGVDTNMSFADLEANKTKDMEAYAATLPPDRQFYRQALESLYKAYMEESARHATAQEEIKKMQDELVKGQQERDKQIAAFQEQFRNKDDDANAQLARFEEDRGRYKSETQDMVAAVTDRETKLQTVVNDASAKQRQLGGEITDLKNKNVELGVVVQQQRTDSFEIADGLIRSINPHNQTVYINLGHADQLRRLITFSVHDAQANTKEGKGKKANIEVIDILDDHLALARILDENLSDPIAPGDKIYTPLWKPGQRLHFAIYGKIDLTHDGQDDRELVKDIITSLGGVVDCEMDQDGKIAGAMSINTRYLIQGEVPEEGPVVTGVTAMITQARTNAVETISAAKFFEMAGWRNPQQLLRFGADGNGQFLLRDRPDGGPAVAEDPAAANFQKRRPWSAKPNAGSAYEDPAPK